MTVRAADGRPVPLPEDFIGLGYEKSSAAPMGLLSAGNLRYVRLVQALGARGVLRIGGIVADYSRYLPDGPNRADRHDTVITRRSLDQLAGFLGRIGWTAIWSLNLAQGTIEDAVAEARAVAGALGERLLALEIGNEVENYGRGPHPFRRSPYGYEAYRAEYDRWHAAITAAVPGVGFAAPDTAANLEWPERMASDARGEVQLLTTHYYRSHQTHGSREQLTGSDPRLMELVARMRAASARSRIPWRLCETNSFSGGGLPGVSDSLLGALWTLDLLLLLAQNGAAGINIETGVNQLGFVSSYSPIQDDGNGVNTAGVPYYGMLAFAVAARGCREVIPVVLDPPEARITAYALGSSGEASSVVLINRDAEIDARVSLHGLGIGGATAIRLTAPSMESRSGITLGGAAVDENGAWLPKASERVRHGLLTVPRGSAVLVRRL